jgi:nucleoside-diphosphate-sugar epimerase
MKEIPVVLVTGSTGLIGSRLIQELSTNHEVVGLDVKPPAKTPPSVDFIQCDLTDDADTGRALARLEERHGKKIGSVIHLAAYYDFSGEPSPLYRKLTVEGTRRLLTGLTRFEVEQFVFSSTILMMEPAEDDQTINETSPVLEPDETWDYPRSKMEAERLIRENRGAIPTVILRIAGVYDEYCHSIPLSQQISRIYEKKIEAYLFPGDAEHGQAFIHLNDLVSCFRRTVAVRRQLGPIEVFLIAEPEVMSYEELQDNIGLLIHGTEWPTIRIPKLVAKAGAWAQDVISSTGETFIKPWMVDLADAHYPVEIERARKRLGWEPTSRLRYTLGEMIAHLKRDPKRWYQINGLNVE